VRGGPAGDLYVVLHVRPHALFRREENDLLCELPVPFDVAALGGEMDVPTLDGFARLKIEAGMENGKMHRIRGKGAPSPDGYGRGDLHVRTLIEVPARLNSKQKKLIKEFKDASEPGNYPQLERLRQMATEFFRRREELSANRG
jgi:molecular chaperone DnaJ